jgi:hypothetical protein
VGYPATHTGISLGAGSASGLAGGQSPHTSIVVRPGAETTFGLRTGHLERKIVSVRTGWAEARTHRSGRGFEMLSDELRTASESGTCSRSSLDREHTVKILNLFPSKLPTFPLAVALVAIAPTDAPGIPPRIVPSSSDTAVGPCDDPVTTLETTADRQEVYQYGPPSGLGRSLNLAVEIPDRYSYPFRQEVSVAKTMVLFK